MLSLRQIAGDLPATRRKTKTWSVRRPDLASSERATLESALYIMGRSFLVNYIRLMLNVDIRWHAPLPEGPKILAANHPTTTDPFYLLPLFPEPVSFLITAGAFDVPGVGFYLRTTGQVPAVRGSVGATVKAVVHKVKTGRSVAIFPEGALSPLAGGFHQPHSGVARVALRTSAPVIPVGIGLLRDRIWVTEIKVDGQKVIGHLYLNGPYAITVGQPQHFEGDVQDRERVRAVAGHIMHKIRDLVRESESRIGPAQTAEADTLPVSILLAGAYAYGFVRGFLMNWLVTVAVTQAVFFLARHAGRPVVERFVSAKLLDKWTRTAGEKGTIFFLLAFVIPPIPSDIMVYVAGLTAIDGRRFFVANFFGRFPMIALFSLVGASGFSITSGLIVGLTVFGVLMLIAWWYFVVRGRPDAVAEQVIKFTA
jgi:1-acyl-sn-glycerol-3-phosphate acyltransferase